MPVRPPRPVPPPLNALRAFEAAARRGGFRQAAEELCVTSGAVAQHIKQLEASIGAPLFKRRARGVELTSLGQAVASDFEKAFDTMAQAAERLRRLAAPSRVSIAALPAIAELFLADALPELRATMPDIEVSVTALETAPNLSREPFDIAIFFEDAADTDTPLRGPDHLQPLCAPKVAERINTLDDLMALPHLTDQVWANDWKLWLNVCHPDARYSATGPTFSLYALAVREALAGAGVLMGHEVLLRDHIMAGTLVPAFPGRAPTQRAMGLTVASEARQSRVIRDVVEVLRTL